MGKQFLLSVILGLLYFVSNGASGCDVAAVNKCLLLLNNTTEMDTLHEGLSAIPTRDQLIAMCSNISEFKACYEPQAALCENDVVFSMTFGTIEKTIDYLCREGYTDILEHSSCWGQPRVAEDTTMCHVQQSQMLKSLQDLALDLNSTDLRTVWCQILDNTTSCMTNAVAKSCEPGAQCIMGTMMTRSLAGLADFMKCNASATTPGCSTTHTTGSTISPPPPGGSTTPLNTRAPPSARPEPGDQGDLRDGSGVAPLTDSRAGVTLLSVFIVFYTRIWL